MSKKYSTSKQVAHRIKVIETLKRLTPAHDQELIMLKKLKPELETQEKAAEDARKKAKEEAAAQKKAEKIANDLIKYKNMYNESIHKIYNAGVERGDIYYGISFEEVEDYLKFFFPFDTMGKKSGKLNAINKLGQTTALDLISRFINLDKLYSIRILDEINKLKCTGKEFFDRYASNGWIEINKVFKGFPLAVRCALYNMTGVKNTNIGKFEILLGLILTDIVSSKKQKDETTGNLQGDIICASGVSFEVKAFDGRVCCQKIKKNFTAGNKAIESECKKYGISEFSVASLYDLYNKLKSHSLSDDKIVDILATGLVNTYGDNLSKENKEKFIAHVKNHFKDYYYGGRFTVKSAINLQGVFDTWSYALIENFTHLIICSKAPNEENWEGFDVVAKMFSKDDINSPEKVYQLLKDDIIYFDGKLNEDSVRDVAVHIYIKKGTC